MASIGDNGKIGIRKLMLRDNHISANAGQALCVLTALLHLPCCVLLFVVAPAGELVVDALYRNQTITVADFRGNNDMGERCGNCVSVCCSLGQATRSTTCGSTRSAASASATSPRSRFSSKIHNSCANVYCFAQDAEPRRLRKEIARLRGSCTSRSASGGSTRWLQASK